MSPPTIIAIAAVSSAIVSVIAVFIAFRSSEAAKRSSEVAAAAFQRSAIRELIVTCREAVLEERRVQDLCAELRSSYKTVFVLAGTPGGSAEQQAQTKVDTDSQQVARLASEASSLAADDTSLRNASGADIDQRATKVGLALVEIRAIRESLERRLKEAQGERERILKDKA